ncbi:glycosyltransferase family 4 protein [Lapillicoccus jejuensis]|uniref:D-inositol 3-phosphate glycosyltransferase n=1 Tax=Lapillicoccus jejuensis TaxID=402171 RepID=A0A542E1L9_9MICO|nr:glycosyltransferase family 4 protein [Lapillicoccus jejuensis]TQJ09169.1 glycosyl transferase family 1 [Lapillicoccus jejuensis]
MTDLGFACHWGPDRDAAWSGTPVRLLGALQPLLDVQDLDVTLPPAVRQVLRVASARRTPTGWRSHWRHSPIGVAAVERRTRALAARRAAGAPVLQVGDLAQLDQPYYLLQDLSYELLLQEMEAHPTVPHFRTLDRRDLERLHRRQQHLYRRATGVLAMSRWLADSVVRSGADPARVHVVNPGVNVPLADTPVAARRPGGRARLLFVGRDFDTKAGDTVVRAYALLRDRLGDTVTLTIAGPKALPGGLPRPPGLDVRGPLPGSAVRDLYEQHDLLVMPSRFEGFGIVFAEALSRGLPVVGRRACAMPEIIDAVSGGLVDGDDPEELAAVVTRVLGDDAVYATCAARAPERREHYTWGRAAAQVASVVAPGSLPFPPSATSS